MDRTGQWKVVFLKVWDHLREHGIVVTLHPEVFLSGDDPFGPLCRCFILIYALHSGQIQTFAEAILPGPERVGKVSHFPPDAHKVSLFIFLCKVCHLSKMRIGIVPKVIT